MKKITLIATVLFGIASVQAQDLNTFFNHANRFFETHVANGKVDYKNIHSNTDSLLEVLKLAEEISVSKDDTNNYQAFWINAYNLSVIKGLIDNYPLKSPLGKKGFFDEITHKLAGKTITLNDIEHKLLRGQFKDARFHFVLVCGAVGCPPLISKAYLPGTLEGQLEVQTEKALNGSFLRVNAKKKKVEASEIMKWYKDDFTMDGLSEIDFINQYRSEKIPNNFKLSYFPYNWSVNKQ